MSLADLYPKNRLIAFIAKHKRRFLLGAAASGFFGIMVPAVLLGGNHVVELLDSTAFCTTTCHDVHYVEAVTFKESPHSEVPCASCHVGTGTANLVKSKLNGIRDIIPAITGNYEFPFVVPLKDRRPSSQTCEKCHWSEKFLGDVPQIKTSYGTDESNTKTVVTHVLKVGGGKAEVATGIHWHSSAKVWFLPADDKMQKIAWVSSENLSGQVNEYVDPNLMKGMTPDQIAAGKRLMDCMDCHNRATHLLLSPDQLIDASMSDGSIDASLPYIKREALKALFPLNSSLQQADDKIAMLESFYRVSYPATLREKGASVKAAIVRLKEIARLTTFDKGLDWNTYPDNAKHDKPDANMEIDWAKLAASDTSPGCFRCHGNLVKAGANGPNGLPPVVERTGSISANTTESGRLSSNSTAAGGSRSDPVVAGGPGSGTTYPGGLSANATAARGVSSNVTAHGDGGPGPGFLSADCGTCHYTLKSNLTSPIAPATSHPVDGLDDCLVCHGDKGTAPLKSSHPWSTNEACGSCHQSAPKLKTLSAGEPPADAKNTPHPIKKLEDCLVCHGPTGGSAVSKDHPWSTDATCASCHNPSATPKPIPAAAAPSAKQIPHPVDFLKDCLACHGPKAARPFAADHPWSTDETCTSCHAVAPVVATIGGGSLVKGPPRTHVAGEFPCTTCHKVHGGIPDDFCGMCHSQLLPASVGAAPPPSGSAPQPPSGSAPPPSGSAPPPSGSTPAPVADPSQLFSANCAICHGVNRQGGAGPAVTATALSARTESWIASFLTSHNTGASLTAGQRTAMATWLKAGTPTVTAPAAPSALAAAAIGATRIDLTWVDNAGNETGFRIERATNTAFTLNLVTATAATNAVGYSDTTVAGSTTYYYRVFATNSAGASPASNVITPATPAAPGTVPAAPSVLAAAAVSATRIDLTWTDNANNETGFRVERATNTGFSAGLASYTLGAGIVSYSDITVSGSTTYYYRVFATNATGSSAASNTASATTPAPVIDAAALYSSSCAACHGVNRQGGGGPAITAAALSGRTESWIVTFLTSHNTGASLTAGQRTAMATWLKAGTPTVTVPAAPSALAATAASATRINLTWVDNANNETGFRVQRATNTGFSSGLTSFTTAAGATSYGDTTVAATTTYYYRVFATNAAGDSTASGTASAATPAAPATVPAAPSVLAAAAVSATRIDLTWTDNANNETGFRVERATNTGFSAGLASYTLGAGIVSYSDITVSGSTTYYYRVFATNATGSSAASNTASATTPAPVIDAAALYSSSCAACHGVNRQGGGGPAITAAALSGRTESWIVTFLTSHNTGASLTAGQRTAMATWLKAGTPTVTVPAAPSALAATAASATRINLTWVDNANNETGFRVQRATNTGFSSGLTSFTTAAGATSYGDTTVAATTTYYYRVFATNAAGDSTASGTASAATPAAPATVPATPSALTAAAVSATRIDLTWTDASNNEASFVVQRAANSGFSSAVTSFTTAANAVAYSDTTVAAGTTYYYRVSAGNTAGTSAASNTASVSTPAASINASQLYSTNCASCHGANRQGGGGPRITASALSGRTESWIVSFLSGHNTGRNLTSAERTALAQWLKVTP